MANSYLPYIYEYSPYGRVVQSFRANTHKDRYLSTGHEREEATDYDYRLARLYDAELGRFLSVDPLADHPIQISMSTYSAFWNNPIRYVDLDGRCPGCPPPGIRNEMRQSIPGYTYMPSGEVSQLINKGLELINNAFDYSVEGSATIYGAVVSGQLGPIKGKAGASVFEGKIESKNENIVKAEGKLVNATFGVGFGSSNAEGSVSGAVGSLSITQSGAINVSGQLLPVKGEATLGQNGFDITLDNSTRVAAGVKIGSVKADAGVNFGRLAQGTGVLIKAGVQYLLETTDKMIDQ